jgi:transposase
VWAQDEARLGLKPIVRRAWALRGRRPIAPHETRYQWLYACGFVNPQNGRTHWLLLPTVNADAMNQSLANFAKTANPAADKIILLLLDQAGYHLAKEVRPPEGIEFFHLPPYTPELQPAERLWPQLREALANRCFADLDELETVAGQRCNWLFDHPEIIQPLTAFNWIIFALNNTN